jgi:hypothetical protein
MGKQTFVIELDTTGLSQEFFDEHQNDILKRAIDKSITPGHENSWHVKAAVDHTKKVFAKVDVSGLVLGDGPEILPIDFNANRLENIQKLGEAIQDIEAASFD